MSLSLHVARTRPDCLSHGSHDPAYTPSRTLWPRSMASRDAVSTPGRDTRRLPDRASENANSGVLRAELFQFPTHVYLLMASGVSCITTATNMEDPKIVLVDILTTLHRLEARFDDQSDRISVIERCVSPEPDQNPTLRRSASSRTWASERVSAERMAAEYKNSVETSATASSSSTTGVPSSAHMRQKQPTTTINNLSRRNPYRHRSPILSSRWSWSLPLGIPTGKRRLKCR
jgi:hypothetical protein